MIIDNYHGHVFYGGVFNFELHAISADTILSSWRLRSRPSKEPQINSKPTVILDEHELPNVDDVIVVATNIYRLVWLPSLPPLPTSCLNVTRRKISKFDSTTPFL